MLSLIGQNWTHFLWALIATIMMVIIGFLTPLLLSEIVDSILGSEPFTMPDFLMNPINDLGGRDFLRQNLWIPALALILMNIVNGVFDVTAIVYYLSVTGFFLFLSVQSLEKRRWSE